VRKDLSISDLGDLVELPLLATLATYRRDGSVLLSPVWHEWRDDAFQIIVGRRDGKERHLRNDPRASVVLAESDPPYRGVELSGTVAFEEDPGACLAALRRIAVRYLGQERGLAYAGDSGDGIVLLRLAPGKLRTWDFSDDAQLA